MSNMEPDRNRARELAKEFTASGDPLGWFEQLYQESEQGKEILPWADLRPNPNLTEWWPKRPALGQKALVVGCGLGDDAEFLAEQGLAVTAFDLAPTAVAGARRRFPRSAVDYRVADALHRPAVWRGCFDLVFECYTLQAIPESMRARAMVQIADCVAANGYLLIIARGRDATDPPGAMPWPLTREELGQFESHALTLQSWEDYLDGATRRFRALYRRL